MINKWKIAAVAALMVAGIAGPAFAQSADHTGSQMASYYDRTGKQTWGSWSPQVTASPQKTATNRHSLPQQNGYSAFASVPSAGGSYGRPALPGGSIGYNENLRTDQW